MSRSFGDTCHPLLLKKLSTDHWHHLLESIAVRINRGTTGKNTSWLLNYIINRVICPTKIRTYVPHQPCVPHQHFVVTKSAMDPEHRRASSISGARSFSECTGTRTDLRPFMPSCGVNALDQQPQRQRQFADEGGHNDDDAEDICQAGDNEHGEAVGQVAEG